MFVFLKHPPRLYPIGSQGLEENDGAICSITKKQEARLVQFRQHKVNLMVGTSILESGIDLPKCNLVAMFDPPLSYRSYIKSKVSLSFLYVTSDRPGHEQVGFLLIRNHIILLTWETSESIIFV